jgi:hypothetical protein
MNATGEKGDCKFCPGHPDHHSQKTQRRLKALDNAIDSIDFTTADILGVDEVRFAEMKAGVWPTDYQLENKITRFLIRAGLCPDCCSTLIHAAGCHMCQCGWELCS